MHTYIKKLPGYFLKEPGEKTIIIFLSFIILLYLVPIWSFKYMPFEDGPNHLLSVQIINNMGTSSFDYKDNFAISFSIFKPYALYFIIMIALTHFIPLLISEKIFLSLYILLFVISFFIIAKIVLKQNLFISSVVFIFIYNLMLLMGFYEYLFSIPVFLFTLAYYQSRQKLTKTLEIIILNLLMLILFFTHITSLAALLVTIFILELLKNRNLRALFVLGLKLSPAIALAMYTNIHYAATNTDIKPVFSSVGTKFQDISRWFNYHHIFNGHDLLYYIIIFLLLVILLKTILQKPSLEDLSFFIAGLVLFILYLLLPKAVTRGTWISIRILPYVFLIAFLSLKGKIHPVIHNLFLISIFIISLVITFNCFKFVRDQNKVLQTYLSGIEVIHQNPKILPLNPYVKGWNYHSLLEAWAYYHIEKGGVGPYSFARIDFYPVGYSHKIDNDYLPNPGENTIERLDKKMVLHYDYVFLSGRDLKVEELMNDTAFRKIFTNNIITIWEKNG